MTEEGVREMIRMLNSHFGTDISLDDLTADELRMMMDEFFGEGEVMLQEGMGLGLGSGGMEEEEEQPERGGNKAMKKKGKKGGNKGKKSKKGRR